MYLLLYYFQVPGSYKLILDNFAILITNEIAAIVLDDSAENTTIRTIKKISMGDFEKHEEMKTGIYLDKALQQQLHNESISLIFTFFLKDALFNDELTNFSTITGNVVGIAFSNTTIEPKGSFW